MKLFYYDIETCGEYKDFESLELNDERGANLFRKKYGKMYWEEKYGSIEKAYIENAGIISTFGRICCISFGVIESNGNKKVSSYYGEDEKDIVTKFNILLNQMDSKGFSLCGYRIKYFDNPWVLHKLHKYGITPSGLINSIGKKPWELKVVDLADDWKGSFAWSSSFDEVCYELEIDSPKDSMDGSEVHGSYWRGEYGEIKEYCEKDVKSNIEVSLKIYT
jgi:predicted PolB exonuclease-like 3'-5' exonuclease